MAEASPGQHEAVGAWQEHHPLDPPAAGVEEHWPANTISQQGHTACKALLSQPCCKPEQNPVLCLAWHGRLFPRCGDAQISSGFTLLSTLGKKMDGPRVPHRSFPLANPVPPCAVCTTEPCCIRDQYGNPGTAAGTLPAGHIQPCTAKVSTLLMGEKK